MELVPRSIWGCNGSGSYRVAHGTWPAPSDWVALPDMTGRRVEAIGRSEARYRLGVLRKALADVHATPQGRAGGRRGGGGGRGKAASRCRPFAATSRPTGRQRLETSVRCVRAEDTRARARGIGIGSVVVVGWGVVWGASRKGPFQTAL